MRKLLIASVSGALLWLATALPAAAQNLPMGIISECWNGSGYTPCTPATPLSPMQAGLGVASSTALTVPTGAIYAVVCAEGQAIRYTTDGTTTPTAAIGMPLQVNQCVSLLGATTIANFRAIQQSATATIDVSYYK
ncbi:hypothetical protein ACRQ5Q_22195 [Bradyrhizobium sp. PMVTL-01]|uniref:hypothetical protein n=1 Tax=Bradyrhizobium sp. PMVTL-01 TaxID=3434999 RepID=UPI003F6F6818